MIHLHDLTLSDIGRWVVYRSFNKVEEGRIKSWNQSVIWVVYNCNAGDRKVDPGRYWKAWSEYEKFTGQPTDPNDLEFKE